MKLRNKLILSCAALAAVATTAVSTTYAWYTSNQEVTAEGVTASTSSSSDALLLISTSGLVNTWSSKVDLDIDVSSLAPVTKVGDAYKKWTADANDATTAAVAGTDYITFSLYFKSGNGNPLIVNYKTFDLVNTTGTLKTKSVLSNAGLPADATSSGVYSVDLLKALTMENTFSNTVEASEGAQAPHGETTGTAAYEFAGLAKRANYADSVNANTVNAHAYYNDVKGLDDVDSETETTADDPIDATKDGTPESRTNVTAASSLNSAFSTNTYKIGGVAGTESTNILRVDYVIYLDGWDKHCFDACQGQTFTLTMTFNSTAATA